MDPVIIAILGAVAGLITILGTGAKVMFDRQEKRIAALEAREAAKQDEHTNCREELAVLKIENAHLKDRVSELERRLGIETAASARQEKRITKLEE